MAEDAAETSNAESNQGIADDLVLETSDLYHYTTVEGLYGILESGELWATHAGYLNDTEEFTYGLGIIMDELRDIRADLETRRLGREAGLNWQAGFVEAMLMVYDPHFVPAEEDFDLFKDMPPGERAGTYNYLWDVITPFVTCLSTERDQLSQWRGYARGGYSIRFDSKMLQTSMKQVDKAGEPVGAKSPPRLIDVLYVADDFRGEIRDAILETLDDSWISSDGRKQEGNEAIGLDEVDFLCAVFLQGSRLKNHKFFEEAEYRISVSGRETFQTPSLLGLTPRTAVSFDASAVREVIVGPSEFADVRAASLRRYLGRRKGYEDTIVSVSEIPYREL
ncbi:hypothetical protein NJB18091_23810 [Mycobacterium marinum]|uniref:DUF2971 domain-containing protein n=1 Tax=Mycobacterium marinum TaxID=1781 RepID=UPI0021C3C9A2|nr:DUF2971 domain-containing protein [Mycobacterium marinum]GJN97016.1 hypothetical protein NJB18091_23810 [Mycobacterium marinum]